ncbi:ABC transporter ATP-binding protein [Roseobacter sp.]|uniref:ABC transporter ATP-binding protein n=1 Tax=Roseobacter sp. TaxID=1907202 RepID=UPI003297A963
MVAALRLRDLSVAAPSAPPLLDQISFDLAQGERIGLVGASGCGKSLTAAAICGLLRSPLVVSGGGIDMNGAPMIGASAKTWRKARGRVVFQIFQSPGTALTPARRVGVQLNEAARTAGAVAKTAVPRALDAVKLARDVPDLFPYQLSGGMKQRVLIAMALLLRPRILIADEPTTGLDVLTEQDILAALKTAADETGASVVFISHDLRAVAAIAQRSLVMDQGRIVEDANIADLALSAAPAARALAQAAAALQSSC